MEIRQQIEKLQNNYIRLRNRVNKLFKIIGNGSDSTGTDTQPGVIRLYPDLEADNTDGAPTQQAVKAFYDAFNDFKDGFKAGEFIQENVVNIDDFEVVFDLPMRNAYYSVTVLGGDSLLAV